METYRLIPHPNTPPERVVGVEVELLISPGDDILLTFRVDPGDALRVPEWKSPGRADALWETTCFELFLKPESGLHYLELNFSPSGEWAAYRFGGYREGMAPLEMPVDPHIARLEEEGPGVFEVDFDLSAVANVPHKMSVTAVIEELSGRRSFWALAHPPGEPDFHDETCFTLELPAAPPP